MANNNFINKLASKLYDYLSEPANSMYVSFEELHRGTRWEKDIVDNYLLMAAKLVKELECFQYSDVTMMYLIEKLLPVITNDYIVEKEDE